MRALRLTLSLVPFAGILVALGFAKFWWEFGVVAVVSAAIWIGSAVVALRSRPIRRGTGEGTEVPPRRRWVNMTSTERADFFDRKAWSFGAIGALVGLAILLPAFRREAWWVLPVVGFSLFVVIGLTIRLGGRWLDRYEQEFERYTKGPRGHKDEG